MPSTPGFHLFACTRFKACKQFPHSQTSSINFSVLPVGLSVPRFAVNDSTPSPGVFRASLVASGVKAKFNWFFCRCSLIESRCLFTTPHRSGLPPVSRSTTPSADFCRRVRKSYLFLRRVSATNGRPPEVRSTAFRAQPPDLPPVPLMDVSFAVICPLARHRRPPIRFLSIGSHFWSTLLSDVTSRPPPLRFAITSPPSGCEEDFHLQAVEHARHTNRMATHYRCHLNFALPNMARHTQKKKNDPPNVPCPHPPIFSLAPSRTAIFPPMFRISH